ncbi:hypothetical protein GCM10010391_56700 [Streptomyces anthocyanicus]|nr:hypothetical protein GCM10010391_56700 [Streptomyces anthocyanicus]
MNVVARGAASGVVSVIGPPASRRYKIHILVSRGREGVNGFVDTRRGRIAADENLDMVHVCAPRRYNSVSREEAAVTATAWFAP